MERLPPAPGLWRLFAIIMLLILGAMAWTNAGFLGEIGINAITANLMFWLLAILGLVGYAFGLRFFGVLFWRVYAIILGIVVALRAIPWLGTLMGRVVGGPNTSPYATSTIIAGLSVVLLAYVAVLRHAELTGDREA